MPLAYFPELHPDEILASATARYQQNFLLNRRQTLSDLHGGPSGHTSLVGPQDLTHYHRVTSEFTGMSFKKFLGSTTLYPYYFAYAAESSRVNFIEKSCGRSAPKGSIFSSWNFTLNKIKACPDCISADTEKFGEPYWHRCHQVDAVHICHSHGIPLLSARTQFFDSPHILLEPLSHRTEMQRYLPNLTEKARQRLTEVADEAEQLMREGLKGPLRQPIANSVGSTLRRVYPLRDVINMTDLEIDMVDFFGVQCLEILGLTMTPG